MAEVFSYKTVVGRSESLYKEKGSKFIGYAFPISSETEFKDELARVKKEHHQARHHCYAYVLEEDGSVYRATDDGEPNGTAGRPILAPIQGRGLTFIAVIVVRYFGGTKLGKGGLVRAYGNAAKEALEAAQTREVKILVPFSLKASIATGEKLRGQILDMGGSIDSAEYSELVKLGFRIPMENAGAFEKRCIDLGIEIKAQT